MNCNILESLMLLLLLLLARVVVARLLWGCCRRQARTEMPIYCLLPAYCPRDNRELKSRRAAEKSQHIQQQYNNNNTSCKLMCRGGTKCKSNANTCGAQIHSNNNNKHNSGVDTELMFRWFLLLPEAPKLLMCTIFQRRSASTFKWQKWRDNNNNNTSDINNNCTMNLRIA